MCICLNRRSTETRQPQGHGKSRGRNPGNSGNHGGDIRYGYPVTGMEVTGTGRGIFFSGNSASDHVTHVHPIVTAGNERGQFMPGHREQGFAQIRRLVVVRPDDRSGIDDDSAQAFEFVGTDKEIEGSSADSLSFTSRAHLVFSEQEQAYGTAEIGYYVGENNETEDLVLYRTDCPAFQEKPEEGTGGLVMCDSLTAVNFTYYDDKGEEHDSWDSTSDEFKNKIPRMVSIMLEFVNDSDPEAPFKFLTKVAFPIGQG